MQADLIEKYSTPVPRYTSYPAAPHFHDAIGEADYRAWLGGLAPQDTLSLYLHIPFCDTLCWFCGCHTKMIRAYHPIERYLKSLVIEIEETARLVPHNNEVVHIHWGGGSPTILKPGDIAGLADQIRASYRLSGTVEFGVEIDPRGLGEDRISALAEAGVNRVSIGVQDFDPNVQSAINRIQSFEETENVILGLRQAGIKSVNLDLLYGLPHQTSDSIARTVERVLSLAPDRISLFGYAHVPWMKRHQSMIDEAALPGAVERFQHARRAADLFTEAGYVRIGLDHFARPGDPLVEAQKKKTLRRNFQGYTNDCASALIGLGASAIGKLPEGYVQNVVPMAEYERRVQATGLAAARGLALSGEDHLRAHVIERLMCDLEFDCDDLVHQFGDAAQPIINEAHRIVDNDPDQLVARTPEGFRVTEKGRPFIRSICACFDPYLEKNGARYSIAV